MKKAWLLLLAGVVFFSLKGFSQTPEKSTHPLLDKYYPRPKVDTPETVIIQRPSPEAALPQKIVPQNNSTIPIKKPVAKSEINPETKPLTATPDSTMTAQPDLATPVISDISAPSSPVASAPVKPVVTSPAKKAALPKPSTPYNRERLGSSSPLYNTWEKNNNGAGSVTTGSK